MIGLASLGAATVGLMGGGEVVDYGFVLGAQIAFGGGYNGAQVEVYASPYVHLGGLESLKEGNWGLTIGSVTLSNGRYSTNSDLMAYEKAHTLGWLSKGASYLGDVVGNPCQYDPLADWSINCEKKGLGPKDTMLGINHSMFSYAFQVGDNE